MHDDVASTGPELSDGGPGRGTVLFLHLRAHRGGALSDLGRLRTRTHPGRASHPHFRVPHPGGLEGLAGDRALALGVIQVLTALRIYGRIRGGPTVRAVTATHRVSGVVSVVLTLPVVLPCLWSLGSGSYSTRILR